MNSKKNTKLSILVTFYNQKEYIKEALDSIVNQKVSFEYEVLIGLNNNDTESENIIKEYTNKYPNFRLYKIDNSKEETISIKKASNNRTNLINHAQGEYFCLLDGDDFYCDNDRFEILVKTLDINKNFIGAGHSMNYYDHTQKIHTGSVHYSGSSAIISLEDYLKSKKHISACCFIFRNIFYGQFPSDFPPNYFNDSTITHYMLKYGDLFYIPKMMLSYRVEHGSIFSSKPVEIQKLYELLSGEINHKVVPVYSKLLCKKYKKLLVYLSKNLKKIKNNSNNSEMVLIKEFAQKNKCYYTENIINFHKLSIFKKVTFLVNCFLYVFFYKTVFEKKYYKTFYFKSIPNFGDLLNIYIFNRILNLPIKYENIKNAQLIGIGSILGSCLLKIKLKTIFKSVITPVLVWGSGIISDDDAKKIKKLKVKRRIKCLALRGKETLDVLKDAKYNVSLAALGDPGLLCSKLIDQEVEKKYKLGVILHYVDINNPAVKNIKISDYKLIDITKNPIQVIKEISECEFILSSAMHGLIAADSLNIPNKRIKLSSDIIGGDFKYKDYYSVFNYYPTPIDLNKECIVEDDIEKFKQNWAEYLNQDIVSNIQNELIRKFPGINN